jgi:hypothetical protein
VSCELFDGCEAEGRIGYKLAIRRNNRAEKKCKWNHVGMEYEERDNFF